MITIDGNPNHKQDENKILLQDVPQTDGNLPEKEILISLDIEEFNITYNNAPARRKTFQKKASWTELPDRKIIANVPDDNLLDNSIQTTKYNFFNFIPKNLMEQFSKLANVYFLVSF